MRPASLIATAATALWGLVGAAGAARAGDVVDYPKTIASEYAAGRIGSAVVLCEEAEKAHQIDDDAATRQTCAQAMVIVGDKLLAAGSPENARKRWLQAVQLDPRLLDDSAFVKKLASVTPDNKPPDDKPPDVKPPDNKPPDIKPPDIKPPEVKPPEVKPAAPQGPPGDAGPRWSRTLGLGLSFGFDGVLAADIGWLVDERWLVEVALGIVYPTTDVRFRWLGLKRCLTPYLGVGLIVPFGTTDRFDFNIGSFRALYELGEAVHIDVGLAYTPVHRLDITLGIAFLTPFDQDHPDTVMFFPQLSGSVSWYF